VDEENGVRSAHADAMDGLRFGDDQPLRELRKEQHEEHCSERSANGSTCTAHYSPWGISY
jgi:hypothetical protein